MQLKDSFNREINYARISVTDLCNMRCRYCMPEGIQKKPHNAILSIEELCFVSDVLSKLGVKKQRITGGEPLVRRGIMTFFEHAGANPYIENLAITTNGQSLAGSARELRRLGVNALNISVDTLDHDKYRALTVYGELSNVIKGIDAAMDAGFEKIKLNAVLLKGINDSELKKMADFARLRKMPMRFIELMPFACQREYANQYFIGANEVIKVLNLQVDNNNIADDKVENYVFPDGTPVSFIRPVTNRFCTACNRLRITADGKLLNCLHECKEYDIKPHLGDKEALTAYIKECVLQKPAHHNLDIGELQNRDMEHIGG